MMRNPKSASSLLTESHQQHRIFRGEKGVRGASTDLHLGNSLSLDGWSGCSSLYGAASYLSFALQNINCEPCVYAPDNRYSHFCKSSAIRTEPDSSTIGPTKMFLFPRITTAKSRRMRKQSFGLLCPACSLLDPLAAPPVRTPYNLILRFYLCFPTAHVMLSDLSFDEAHTIGFSFHTLLYCQVD